MRRACFWCAPLTLVLTLALAPAADAPPAGPVALRGARIHTAAGKPIDDGVLVIDKGKIVNEIGKGKAPYQAILDGGTSKMRPVCMVVITTVLGMIPLLTDAFFGAMAVCIMFGLACAAVLSLIVTPVLYAIFFRVREPDAKAADAMTKPA